MGKPITDQIVDLSKMILKGEKDSRKFDHGNTSAGIRLRKRLQNVRREAKRIRLEMQKIRRKREKIKEEEKKEMEGWNLEYVNEEES